MNFQALPLLAMIATLLLPQVGQSQESTMPLTYRFFEVEDDGNRVAKLTPAADENLPRWASEVSQETFDWQAHQVNTPTFRTPIPFVIEPVDEGEYFGKHNHQPSIAWLPNGDLFAIWYTTENESGTELTVLASRKRAGRDDWEPSSVFFKASDRNMHGSSIFHDGDGSLYHFNGMGPLHGKGWAKLALLVRKSNDNGVTWTTPLAIAPEYAGRHQVISGTMLTSAGKLVQNCDAVPGPHGGTALHISDVDRESFHDPGKGQPSPSFAPQQTGKGTIAGIHAKVIELADGRWMAMGRGDAIEDRMPMSISTDQGKTWSYQASPFPSIGSGQRLCLLRLNEGPLLFISFTSGDRRRPEANPLEFVNQKGETFLGNGMFAAISFDQGKSWPLRKLLTPGDLGRALVAGGHTGEFIPSPTRAEHAGYLAVTQSPDNMIHLISSRLHYSFNIEWLLQGSSKE